MSTSKLSLLFNFVIFTLGVFASFASTAYRVAMSNFLGLSLGAVGKISLYCRKWFACGCIFSGM